MSVSTKTLDHIVHLTPPGTVDKVSDQFKSLGFTVIPGGTHSSGLTANALVIIGDGVYLELISFTHPQSHYPPGTPKRKQRDSDPWAFKEPGWVDFAFLGSSTTSIADIINARAERDKSGIRYEPEIAGGRTREDGRVLKWVISETLDDHVRGLVPFFCGDVTPRGWRVPVDPPSNSDHPSGVERVAYIRQLVDPDELETVLAQITSVIGEKPEEDSDASVQEYTWTLDVPLSASSDSRPRLVLSVPTNEEEREYLSTKGPGIFEVGFSVGDDGTEREAHTPYGKIVWSKA